MAACCVVQFPSEISSISTMQVSSRRQSKIPGKDQPAQLANAWGSSFRLLGLRSERHFNANFKISTLILSEWTQSGSPTAYRSMCGRNMLGTPQSEVAIGSK